MKSITTLMTKNHRACDASFVDLESRVGSHEWESANAAFDAFRAATLRHFRMEEEVLFPAFEEATGSTQGPTAVMRMEHDQLRALLHQLGDGVEARDEARVMSITESFMVLIQQHNMKEEQILYPMADNSLASIPDLIGRMQSVEP